MRPPVVIAWCALLGLSGCGGTASESLDLTGLTPRELEPGGDLIVQGAGFPGGRDGSLRLVGDTHRPGQPSLPVDVQVPAHALSSARLSAAVDPQAFAALGTRGTFRGELIVRLATTTGEGAHVTGRLARVKLDLAGTPSADNPSRELLRDRSEDVLSFVGLQLDEAAESHAGLRLSGTTYESTAAQAGLSPGDLLVEANGVSLHALDDLAPPPGAPVLALLVKRSGHPSPVRVELSLAGFELAILDPSLRPLALLLIGALWFLAFYGPFASPSLWLARVQSRIRYGDSPLWAGLPTADLTPGSLPARSRPLARIGGLLAASLLTLVAVLDARYGVRFDGLQLYLAMTALLVWAAVRSPGVSHRARLRRARLPLLQMTVVVLMIGSACLVTGARSLHDLVDDQGALPVRWGLFTQPALFLLFPVFVLMESKPAALDVGRRPLPRALAYLGFRVSRHLVCGLSAAVLLGGWAHHELVFLGETRAALFGAGLFVCKAYGLSLLIHAARSLSIGRRRSPWVLAGLIAAAIGTTAAFLYLGLGQDVRVFCGTVLASAAALVTVTAGIRVLCSDAPMGSTPRHAAPFS